MKGSYLSGRQIDVSVRSGAYQSIHNILIILSPLSNFNRDLSRFDYGPLGQSLVMQNKLFLIPR